ncbi:MFS transporter [Achromobacter denitrificans]|uniref:MFS transporter n=1 Tax=Achromobacter denitrificans TaxID=32002 RepID=A0ABZ3G1A3_ACHDE|nr:MFS transporter [Achromobacter denitrificans]MDX3879143.1 MFS transporter [Achromobacter sp.]MBV2161492.1 MFS transporter [Achromobacter denitrificans]MDF3849228.1 MFS transporter [Achromobacter denitrificans]MDF3940221.1 MFS transporter [Achromobacter denitrificans]RSE88261.1 MFS transporter [Achromobacter denitrificans]
MSALRKSSLDAPQLWLLVLAGGVVMGLALGVRHVQGLFLLPVTMDRGWSRETFAMALAVQNLTWGIAQPFTGMVADRYGSAKVIVAGLACYALGLAGMAHAATPAAFLWTAGVCIGIALSGTAFAVIYGALSRLVAPERRSWALGVAGAVGGLGQFTMVPAAQWLIGGWGWVAALLSFAVACALLLPLALPLREPAGRSQGAASPGADLSLSAALREAFSQPGFWLLNLGFLACGFQLAFIGTHLPAYLMDKGLRAADAVAALAIIALANVMGTYVCGMLGGHHRRKHLLAGIYLIRSAAIALFVLLPLSAWSVYLFAAVMGFVWLGTVPLTNGLISQVFGVRYITTLFGFVFFGHQLGSFLGVWLGGVVFEATRSYDLIWLGAMALGLLSAALHWPIDDREIRRVGPAGAG